jgi:hypothetical protein
VASFKRKQRVIFEEFNREANAIFNEIKHWNYLGSLTVGYKTNEKEMHSKYHL